MSLLAITDVRAWDAFMTSQPRSQFTQSWAWGEFRIAQNQQIQRLALVGENGEWDAAALFIFYSKPLLGGYWYAPRGPVIRNGLDASEILARFIDALERARLSRAPTGSQPAILPGRALFWRVEPPVLTTRRPDHPTPWVRSHAFMPASTLLVDLTKSEDDLQKEMHEKTRYNVRVAERKGVTVRVATEPDAIESFLKLNEETAVRDRFTSLPAAYIRATYASLSTQGIARLRFAEFDGKLLAASMEMSYGDTTTYLYGASSSAARNVMAPYALHWDAIRSAKADGKRFYDFHGVNPSDSNSPYFKKSWEGITRFKRGWGGEIMDYAGTWELPRMGWIYRLYRIVTRSGA